MSNIDNLNIWYYMFDIETSGFNMIMNVVALSTAYIAAY